MRDPNRIDKFCEGLKTIWHQVPDWRFGQLIYNFMLTQYTSGRAFYAEDGEMLAALKKKLEELKNE